MSQKPIYLDYNATTPVHPDLRPKILEWLDNYGNPSSIHSLGREGKRLLREARVSLAEAIDVQPIEIIFTSGGSEANSMAIQGALRSPLAASRREIIVSPVEHASVAENMDWARQQGFTVHTLSVNSNGELDLQELISLLSEKTLLVSVMMANNETGIIYPIKKIAQKAKEVGALVHTDGVQSLGRLKFHLSKMDVDFASFSGHKVYATKGVGALYCRRGVQIPPLILGGGQERGRRAGTENTLAIASFGFMAQHLKNWDLQATLRLRQSMEERVLAEIQGVQLVGAGAERMPNTANFIVEGVPGESLLMSLDLKGFCVSAGSACSSGKTEPSPVLRAMGISTSQAQSSLRVSLGWMTQASEVQSFVDTLKTVVEHLRQVERGYGEKTETRGVSS